MKYVILYGSKDIEPTREIFLTEDLANNRFNELCSENKIYSALEYEANKIHPSFVFYKKTDDGFYRIVMFAFVEDSN